MISARPLLAQRGPSADASKPLPSIAEKTTGTQSFPGYFDFYWDAKGGKIWPAVG